MRCTAGPPYSRNTRPYVTYAPAPNAGKPHASRPEATHPLRHGARHHRIRVAHSCTLAIRCRSCPAVASALGGPPHTRRSSVWITPCGLPL